MPKDNRLSFCADLVKRYDRDRFLTALFAPPGIRERLMTLYAFNAEVARIRETVTEPLIGQMRLQWWRDVITAVYDGKDAPKGHPVAEPLAGLINDADLSSENFDVLLKARDQDMSDEPPATQQDLTDYCRDTSASLACLALEAISVTDDVSRQVAVHMGTAWALTGIARAVRFHALSGHVMLPQDALATRGLTLQDLQNPERADGAADIIADLCNVAEEQLSAARADRDKVDLKGLPVFLQATLADAYLGTLARANYRPYDPAIMRQRPAVVRLWWNAWRKRF